MGVPQCVQKRRLGNTLPSLATSGSAVWRVCGGADGATGGAANGAEPRANGCDSRGSGFEFTGEDRNGFASSSVFCGGATLDASGGVNGDKRSELFGGADASRSESRANDESSGIDALCGANNSAESGAKAPSAFASVAIGSAGKSCAKFWFAGAPASVALWLA